MSYNPFQYNSPEQFASTPSTPAFPLWELDQEQQPSSAQQELPQPQQPQVFVPTIRVPDRAPRASEGQFRLRDYVHQPAIQQSEPEDPQPSGSHSSTSHAGQPVRNSERQRARDAAHPYARPTESQSSAAMRTRRKLQASETGSLRLSIPGASSITLGCPAQGHRASLTVPDATSSATAQLSSNFQQPTRSYGIRADVHFDHVGKVLKAMLELPGVKKSDVKIVLSKCPHTRVKQITVAGISRSVFPDVEYTIRERKFGRFLRVLIVPPETTVDQIVADMEDGILAISVGIPAVPDPAEEPQNITLV